MLAVRERRLGTVWVGAFHDQAVSHGPQLPEVLQPVAVLPIRNPGEGSAVARRSSLSDLVHHYAPDDFMKS